MGSACLDIDASLVEIHTDGKQHAAPATRVGSACQPDLKSIPYPCGLRDNIEHSPPGLLGTNPLTVRRRGCRTMRAQKKLCDGRRVNSPEPCPTPLSAVGRESTRKVGVILVGLLTVFSM